MRPHTIVALSSGQGRAAIAVIRVSGARVRFVIETFIRVPLSPRTAKFVALRTPDNVSVIDRCIAFFFDGPHSSTGEDVLELHVHGGIAVVRSVLGCLVDIDGIRYAEAGEFTRRSLENGKLDLLQVEALGDLLNAETGEQLKQAQRQLSGELGHRAHVWRERLVSTRALIEAELDFSDEGDVGHDVSSRAQTAIAALREEIMVVLGDAARGRRIREGASVVIVGAPNSGKSMLMNALSMRDIAIVSPHAGTTRDVLEAPMDMNGWPVVLVDTAGLRDSVDEVEREGIRRARERASNADLILSVSSYDVPPISADGMLKQSPVIFVGTKSDISRTCGVDLSVSALTGQGLSELRTLISLTLSDRWAGEPALVARERQRAALSRVSDALVRASTTKVPELVAEELRNASFGLGLLVGATDLDTVLDRLFEGFCIGK